jgi:DNA-binding transcriptional LysR family regulator
MNPVHVDLASVDLNLLLAFEALWAERNVTRAGRKLGLSQPAMSGALARLREMLHDPLFLRGRAGLVPTERCSVLAAPLSKALLDIRHALAGTAFEPKTTARRLSLGAVDAAIAVLVPGVAARFVRQAPHAQLGISAIDPTRAVDLVEAGVLDLALTPRLRPSSTVKQRTLFPIPLWVAMRPGHPLARATPSLQALAKFPRLSVSFEGAPQAAGLAVEPTLTVSSFLAAPHLLAGCDAWAVLPGPFAKKLVRDGALVGRPMPARQQRQRLALHMVWPEAQDAAPASKWLRGLVLEAAAEIAGAQ